MILQHILLLSRNFCISLFFYISSVAFISYLQIINLNWAGEGRRGQQSNLTRGGCEHCVYTPKLVVCKWVWSRLTALENSSRSGHRHFPEGSPRRHQDIFMIHPLTTPPVGRGRIDSLDSSICWCKFQQTLSRFHQGGVGGGPGHRPVKD